MPKKPDDNRFSEVEKQAIKWLEASLEEPDISEAIMLAYKSANLLPPDNLIREAAVDKMLDLAKTSSDYKEQVISLLKGLINTDSENNTYSETIYDYYIKEAQSSDDQHSKFCMAHDALIKTFAAPPGARETLLSIWKSSVTRLVEDGDEHSVLMRMAWALAGPELPADLFAETNELWPWVVENSYDYLALEETLSASKSLYKNYPARDECIRHKEIMARTLCNLSKKVASPGVLQKVIMQAARYEGDNEDLLKQITDHLKDLAQDAPIESYRMEAQLKLKEFTARLEQKDSDSLTDKFHDELAAAMDPGLSIEKQLELTYKVACDLDPLSLKGEAAIDRLMDLAVQQIKNGEPGLYYLQQATALAAPGSALAEKALRLVDQELERNGQAVKKVDTATFILWNVKELSTEDSGKYINMWREAITETIQQKEDPQVAFKWIVNVLADTRSSSDLTQAAIPLWSDALDKIKEDTDDLTAFGFLVAMNSRLYKSVKIKVEDCQEIKALLATTLLDCAVDPKLEGMGEIASLAASSYDGDNLIIRQALFDRMESIVESSADKEIKNKAKLHLKRHGDFLKKHANDDQSPPPPPPAP